MTAGPATPSDRMHTFEEGMSRADADERQKLMTRDLDVLRVALRAHPSARKRELYRQVADQVILVAGDFDEPGRRLFERVAGMLFERAATP